MEEVENMFDSIYKQYYQQPLLKTLDIDDDDKSYFWQLSSLFDYLSQNQYFIIAYIK